MAFSARRHLTAAVLGAVTIALAACGTSESAAEQGAQIAATSSVAAEPGSTAPDATSPSATDPAPSGEAWPLVGGGTLDVSTLADQPLALWFWAPG